MKSIGGHDGKVSGFSHTPTQCINYAAIAMLLIILEWHLFTTCQLVTTYKMTDKNPIDVKRWASYHGEK